MATVALSNPIDPSNAPRPSNDSERLVFRQLYETLVRTDCHGRVGPGLASRGSSMRMAVPGSSHCGRTPGSPTARRSRRLTCGRAWTRDGTGRRAAAGRESSRSIGGRSLAIELLRSRCGVDAWTCRWRLRTRILRSPSLSLIRSGRLERDPPDRQTGTLPPQACDGDHRRSRQSAGHRFLVAAGDTRDLLDQGVDLLLTRDPAALEYAPRCRSFSLCRWRGSVPTSSSHPAARARRRRCRTTRGRCSPAMRFEERRGGRAVRSGGR